MQSQSPHNDSPYKNHEQQFECQLEQQDNYQLNVLPTLNSQSSQYSDPPMLIYSYSGISNASSTPELTLHSSRVSQEPSHFIFIKAQKLYNSLQKIVIEIKETLILDDDIILYLMHLYKWNKDRLNQNYYSKAQTYTHLNKILKQKKNKQQTKEGICSVCEEKGLLTQSMLCNHSYCNKCWKDYIKTKLNQNSIFFCCMNKCVDSPILMHSFVEKLFPQLYQMYRKVLCINYAIASNSISFCPSKKAQCDLFCERTQALFDSSVECQCGQFYCFFCRQELHYPATCQDVKKWNKILNSQEGNTKWIEQNTKTCPSCKTPVQKFIGCSKIKCVCGIQFCYQCNSKWNQSHKSNKGQCLQLSKKSSVESRVGSTDFMKVVEQSLSIGRTQKKNMNTLSIVFDYFKQQGLSFKFHGIRKQIADAWAALKWGSISSFLYKKQQVDPFLEQQFIQSISRLMQPIDRLANTTLMYSKQLIAIGDQVTFRRETLRKNKEFWLQAWRSS